MVKLSELTAYTHNLLRVAEFNDYCPNGLQIEGRGDVARVVSGVTASLALVEAAIAHKADALLVHHGYFWKGEDARVIGLKQRRLKALLNADISLLAYHLPLDAHPELGNNAQLAKRLGFSATGAFGRTAGPPIACYTELDAACEVDAMAERIAAALGREPLVIQAGDRPIRRLGWCTGAAQSYIDEAAQLGLDAFISGEISEYTVHSARELGIHYFAAGHHATERYGVQALGEHLAQQFKLEHTFIDIPNPV